MSKYHVETTEIEEVDGVEKSTDIDKYINIDFSAAKYKFKKYEDKLGEHLELIPDNMDFLHELTDIFPLSEFDIKISQAIWLQDHFRVCISLDVYDKTTGDSATLPNSVLISDGDYEYLRGILSEAFPQFKWQTAEEFLESSMRGYLMSLSEDCSNLFSDASKEYMLKLFSEHIMKFKVIGYVDFDGEELLLTAKRVVENALRSAYESQK